jgi:hypothetical protein
MIGDISSSPILIGILIVAALFLVWFLRYYPYAKRDAQEGAGNALRMTLGLMMSDIWLVWIPLLSSIIGGGIVLIRTSAFTVQQLVTMDMAAWSSVIGIGLSAIGLSGMWPLGLETVVWFVLTAVGVTLLGALLGPSMEGA